MKAQYLFVLAAWGVLLIAGPAPAEEPAASKWIWRGNPETNLQVSLRKKFTIDGPIKGARIAATCDNRFTLFLNGQRVLAGGSWRLVEVADVGKLLRQGDNVIAVDGINDDGAGGFICRLEVTDEAGKKQLVVSDKSWRSANKAGGSWQAVDFDDSAWVASNEIGPDGTGAPIWIGSVDTKVLAEVTGADPSVAEFAPRPAENVTAAAGFRVEQVFDVPRAMGSWVALTTDDKGRLIASDQSSGGLYLITPPKIGDASARTKVQKLPVNLSGAQGLVWAFDSLYAMVNEDSSGLHRAKDTDGDGLIDSDEHLMPIAGSGEHGPHGVVLSPDGKSLFVESGNHTKLPAKIAGSRLPQNWGEDLLLPRRWDAGGHAAGVLAPGGWICRVDPTGKQWEVFSIGYRNQYDLAFNADGELFTYDSDMEWDMGSPWYKPTRVCHATDGSEFGWRSGTGNWPVHNDDGLPHVADIGPGSPVGMVFGYGAKFPAKFQKALFLLDWTYSTIYAVHLTPEGASYRGEVQDFVFGQPLQVTDAVVGADGALYFTTGGRGTQSALYRVVYEGSEPTAPVDAHDKSGAELRALRHKLETFHRPGDADMELIWSNLASPDRFLRYAARIALEFQPIDSWKQRALGESNPRAAITALMALARQGKPEDLDGILTALGKLDFNKLSEYDQLAVTRTYGLAFIRLGQPTDAWREKLIAKFDPLFPGPSEKVNAEVVQLLIYLQSPTVVKKVLTYVDGLGTEPVPQWGEIAKRNAGYGGTVKAMMDNMPPVRAFHYIFALRNAKVGWNVDLRRKYFAFFTEAAKHPGGSSYPGFLKQVREEAFEAVPPGERVKLDDIVGVPLGAAPFKFTPPQGPGRKWTRDEALATLGPQVRGRSFDRGHNLYHATSCAKCHRFAGEGGAIGPDLSTAGRKFSLPDLTDAILEPSKAISDQYGSHQVITSDGQSSVGRVVELDGELHIYTPDANAEPKVVKKDDVEMMKVSPISQMPVGLVDTLNEEELKDLIAYILSAGDRNAAVFKQ